MRRFQLLIFDLDGTLIDSAPDLRIAVNRVLADFDLAPLELSAIRHMIGDGATQLVARALAARTQTPPDLAVALKKFFVYYQADPTAHTSMYEGVSDTLTQLHAQGYKLAVCTNKPAAPMREILKRLGMAQFFVHAIGGDSHPFKKPDPRMLTVLMDEQRTTPANTLMIGDSEVDAGAAQAAAVPFVLVSYGYRRGAAEDMRHMAVVDRFAEIKLLLERSMTSAVTG